jgi:hypothetical protein
MIVELVLYIVVIPISLFLIFFIITYIRFFYFEIKLNKILDKQEKEINETRNMVGITLEQADQQEKAIIRKSEIEIQKLTRKRKFALDKLPFFKK